MTAPPGSSFKPRPRSKWKDAWWWNRSALCAVFCEAQGTNRKWWNMMETSWNTGRWSSLRKETRILGSRERSKCRNPLLLRMSWARPPRNISYCSALKFFDCHCLATFPEYPKMSMQCSKRSPSYERTTSRSSSKWASAVHHIFSSRVADKSSCKLCIAKVQVCSRLFKLY